MDLKKHITKANFFKLFVIIGLILCTLHLSKDLDNNGRTKDGRIIVNYWEKWTGIEYDAMKAVVDDFNNSQNKIFVKMLAVSSIEQKLMLATAGGNPPDVAGIWSHNINVFAEKGALLPLNKRLAAAKIKRADYTPIFWDLCSHQGFTWALPTTPGDLALHWNKALFRKAGLNPTKPPKTMTELEKIGDLLTIVEIERDGKLTKLSFADLTAAEKQKKEFKIIQLGYSPSVPGWWDSMWCFWFDGNLWNGKDKVSATNKANLAALDWFVSYPEKYGLENLQAFGNSFGNFASPQNPFLAGKVAMVLQGVWMHNFIDKFSPNMEWGAAPFPSHTPIPGSPVTLAECDCLVIPKGAKHPGAAFEFIRYVNTPKALEKLNLLQRKFSPLAKISPEFMKKHPNPYIKIFIDLAKSPGVRHVPRIPIWNEYKDEMLVAYNQAFLGIRTPAEALGNVQSRVQWKLDRVLRRWARVKNERLQEWEKENDQM